MVPVVARDRLAVVDPVGAENLSVVLKRLRAKLEEYAQPDFGIIDYGGGKLAVSGVVFMFVPRRERLETSYGGNVTRASS